MNDDATTLLRTKLYRPRPAGDAVARPRLIRHPELPVQVRDYLAEEIQNQEHWPRMEKWLQHLPAPIIGNSPGLALAEYLVPAEPWPMGGMVRRDINDLRPKSPLWFGRHLLLGSPEK